MEALELAYGHAVAELKSFLAGQSSEHVLVTGLTGMGKTHLVNTILRELAIPHTFINCPELCTADMGGTERALARLFAQGGVLVLDSFEVIGAAPRRASQDSERRILSVLKYCLDQQMKVKVIGLTTNADLIDPELLRHGRMGKVVQVSLSRGEQRLALLQSMVKSTGLGLQHVADQTHGYSASDLAHLHSLAYQVALEANRPLLPDDFIRAMREIRPSVMAGITGIEKSVVEGPLFGLESVKGLVLSHIVRRLGRGALLYGEPGTGKTSLALSIARASGLNVINLQSSSLRSKFVGATEKNLAAVFSRARECSPSIILLDQIDGLFGRRLVDSSDLSNRLIACMLTELDGIHCKLNSDVFILATCRRPSQLDPALLRPGRISLHLRLDYPDTQARLELVQHLRNSMPLQMDDSQAEEIAAKTFGWSGARIINLFQEAALATIRQDLHQQTVSSKWLAVAKLGLI